jgi:hypothetical protein
MFNCRRPPAARGAVVGNLAPVLAQFLRLRQPLGYTSANLLTQMAQQAAQVNSYGGPFLALSLFPGEQSSPTVRA